MKSQTKVDDLFGDEIKETMSYTALGKTFPHVYAARRHLAEDKLRLAMRETKARLPLITDNPTSNPPATARELNLFDDAGFELRTWLIEHVHELLPALQLVALANPKSQPVEVERVEE
jgi:hypothetical protein